jgi:uncharacterized membrane protein HdeD (DUF308 family)
MSVPEHTASEETGAVHDWWLFLMLGILMIVAGVIAIITPLVTGVAITALVGVLFLIEAVGHLVRTFRAERTAGHILMGVIVAALYAVAGVLLLSNPLRGLLTLTVVLGALFIAGGLFRTVLGLEMAGKPTWGWMLVGGILSLILGIIIWARLPGSAVWAIGLIVGIDLIFFGWSLIAESIVVHTFQRTGMRLAGQH